MNSIINEIEGSSQTGKKQNEIFAAMQEPAVGISNDFDFLNMFESNLSSNNDTQNQILKKPEVAKKNEEIKFPESSNPFDKPSNFFDMAPQNNIPPIINQIDPIFIMKPNPVSSIPSIFNKNEATNNMAQKNAIPSIFNKNETTNNMAQKNADANFFFSNMNLKPAQPKIPQSNLNNVFNNISNNNINQSNNAKGSLGNFDYDPFSEINVKPANTFNNTITPVNKSNKTGGSGWDFDFLDESNKSKGKNLVFENVFEICNEYLDSICKHNFSVK